MLAENESMTYEQALGHVNARRPVLPHSGLKDAIYRLYPRPWTVPKRLSLQNRPISTSDQMLAGEMATKCPSQHRHVDRPSTAERVYQKIDVGQHRGEKAKVSAAAEIESVPYLYSPYIYCAELSLDESKEASDMSMVKESGPFLALVERREASDLSMVKESGACLDVPAAGGQTTGNPQTTDSAHPESMVGQQLAHDEDAAADGSNPAPDGDEQNKANMQPAVTA